MWGHTGRKFLPLVFFALLQIQGTHAATAAAVQCCRGVCTNLMNRTDCEAVVPGNVCPEEEFGLCRCFWVPEDDFQSYYCLAEITEISPAAAKGQAAILGMSVGVGVFVCISCTCYCLRNLGQYEEEYEDEETGELTVVRRKSVVEGFHRLRRMSVARVGSAVGRTGSVYRTASLPRTGSGSAIPRRRSSGPPKQSSLRSAISGVFGGARPGRSGSDVQSAVRSGASLSNSNSIRRDRDGSMPSRLGSTAKPGTNSRHGSLVKQGSLVSQGQVTKQGSLVSQGQLAKQAGTLYPQGRTGSLVSQGSLVKTVSFRGMGALSQVDPRMAGGHPAPNVTADLAHTQSRRINAPAPIFVANPNSQAHTHRGALQTGMGAFGIGRTPSDGSNQLPSPMPDSPATYGNDGGHFGVVYQPAHIAYPLVPGSQQAMQHGSRFVRSG